MSLSTISCAAAGVCVLALALPAGAQDRSTSRPNTDTSTAADRLSIPSSAVWLGTVRLPARVLADGKPLAAGTYRVRLTGEHADDKAVGQLAALERWVEFVQGNDVKGRVLAPVVPAASVKEVVNGTPPARGRSRVQRMRGDDAYYRVWFNYRGDQILIYLPTA
jgi:hypothetical protein